MTRWEYLSITTTGEDYMETMNKLGDRGWELVSLETWNSSDDRTVSRMTMKRPREDGAVSTAGKGRQRGNHDDTPQQ